MPRLDQVETAVDTITLPHSGVRITLRREATGKDKSDSMQAVIGEGFANPRHAGNRYLRYLAAALMTEWDAQDEKGEPIPISPQELARIRDQDDYDFLMKDVDKRATLREEGDGPGAEGPFVPPSTASSPETSSLTQESSRDSLISSTTSSSLLPLDGRSTRSAPTRSKKSPTSVHM